MAHIRAVWGKCSKPGSGLSKVKKIAIVKGVPDFSEMKQFHKKFSNFNNVYLSYVMELITQLVI